MTKKDGITYEKSLIDRLLFFGSSHGIKFKPYYMFIAGVNIIKLAKNWDEIFLWYISRKKKDIKINMRNGIAFYCSGPADLTMLTEIWAIQEYNPLEIPIKEEYTIIDIGAHVGFFSIYAATRAKKGKVYSYEPFQESYDRLTKNISINRIRNIKIYKMAVASKNQKRKFYTSGSHNGCHSLFQRGSGSMRMIQTTNLNDILKNNNIKECHFLKMDCEGAEAEIISSATAETLGKINIIAGELHSDILSKGDISVMMKVLKKNNFKVILNEGLFFALKDKKV